MSVIKKNSSHFLRLQALELPTNPGVYLWRDSNNRILYIGKAKNLRRRVLSYFRCPHPKVQALVRAAKVITHQVCKTDEQAFNTEQTLIAQWKPKYNVLAREPHSYLKLTFTHQPFPVLAKSPNPASAVHALTPAAASALLYYIRDTYHVLIAPAAQPLPVVAKVDGANDTHQYQLYANAMADITPQSVCTPEEYAERVKHATDFLEFSVHKQSKLIAEKMQAAARNLKFEQAAIYRDLIQHLKRSSNIKLKAMLKDHTPANESVEAIGKALGITPAPITMDCFDISHFSGTLVVASCVRFKNAKPDKSNYRKFKVSKDTNDDFRAMQEVVFRRYKTSAVPDLIVIDGGLLQVKAAMKAFTKLKKRPKFIIGLEKKIETIIFADNRPPLNLTRYHVGLKALQYLRDEAHRFANSYQKLLRSKLIRLGEGEPIVPKRQPKQSASNSKPQV